MAALTKMLGLARETRVELATPSAFLRAGLCLGRVRAIASRSVPR